MDKLIQKTKTFLKLTIFEKKLFFKAFFLSAFVHFVTRYFPMRLWHRFLLGKQISKENHLPTHEFLLRENSKLRKTRQMVKLACRYAPWQAKCLVESILIKKLADSEYNLPVYLGIHKTKNTYLAHAWVFKEEQRNSIYKVVSVHI